MTRFQRFFWSSGLANLADGVATLAWVWVASLLTRDAMLIALVPMALRLPWAIFAIPAGVMADRGDRRRLVVAMDALRAVAFALAAAALWGAGALPAAPATGVVSLPLFAALCLAALTVGVAEVFRDNAAQTLLPALVPDAALERANGRLWTLEAVSNQMIGPAFGAFLLGSALGLPFAVNALAYAVAAVLMAQLQGDFRPQAGQPEAWRPALAAAFGFLRGQPLLRLLAGITGFWNMFFAMLSFALILHAQENLRLSAQAYGFVLMGMAAGGALAGLVGDRIIARFGARRVMPAALMLAGVMMLMVPLMPNGWGLAGCFFIFELSGITWNIVSVSLRQRLVPDALRGRVNSIYRLLAWGMIPMGTALAGAMVGWAEPSLGRSVALTLPLWAAGGGLMAVSFSVLPALWRRLARPSGE